MVVFQVAENFVPPLLETVLLDYQKNVPAGREPEVLLTMATIVNKLESHITSGIPQIFDALFECTLDMINKDFEVYPEHRTNFFTLLQAVNSHCFAGKFYHYGIQAKQCKPSYVLLRNPESIKLTS